MEFGKAFSFVFEDSDWPRKVLIAALILLIPIIGELVVLGWALNISKNVMEGNPKPLPDVDFGADLARGFMGFVIGFVYALPITLMAIFLAIVDAILANSANSNAALTAITVVYSCFGLVSLVYGIAVWLIIPAAYTNYLAKGNLGAALHLGEVFGMVRSNIGAYFIVLLGGIVAGFIASLGVIACVIGVLATSAYSYAILGHLFGQSYLEANKAVPAAVVE